MAMNLNNPTAAFSSIYNAIKQDAFYVPRNFQTIGGAWTRDTWRAGEFTVYLEDEGYTQGIMVKVGERVVLNVTRGFNGALNYWDGCEADLVRWVELLHVQPS
jgi:hypothetical protein